MTQISPALCERLGVTYRQVDYWLTQYWPELLDAATASTGEARSNPGSGHPRELKLIELHRLERMAARVRAGMSPAAAAQRCHEPLEYERVAQARIDARVAADLHVAWTSGRGECA